MPYNVFKTFICGEYCNIRHFKGPSKYGHKITRVRTQIIHYIFQVIMTILSLNKLGLHHHVVNRPFKVLIGDTKAICTEGIG